MSTWSTFPVACFTSCLNKLLFDVPFPPDSSLRAGLGRTTVDDLVSSPGATIFTTLYTGHRLTCHSSFTDCYETLSLCRTLQRNKNKLYMGSSGSNIIFLSCFKKGQLFFIYLIFIQIGQLCFSSCMLIHGCTCIHCKYTRTQVFVCFVLVFLYTLGSEGRGEDTQCIIMFACLPTGAGYCTHFVIKKQTLALVK